MRRAVIDLKGIKLLQTQKLRCIAPIYKLQREKDRELYWVWTHRYVSTRWQLWFKKEAVLRLAEEKGLMYLGELSHLDQVHNHFQYKEEDLCGTMPCEENVES